MDLSQLRPLPSGGAVVLTDVTNPLCGEMGAAAVFGPQKGLCAADVPLVDSALRRYASLFDADPERPGAGAAGGTGFALEVWGATLCSGASEIAQLVALGDAIAHSDVVVTGEGSFDGQSAAGKVPTTVAEMARAERATSMLVAGQIDIKADLSLFDTSVALTDLAPSREAAMSEPIAWLERAGAMLAHRYAAMAS